MRIGQINPQPAPPPGKAGEPTLHDKRPQPAVDTVSLSALAETLSEAGPKEARLEQLRAQVAAGSYQVPASELAARIVEEALREEPEEKPAEAPQASS